MNDLPVWPLDASAGVPVRSVLGIPDRRAALTTATGLRVFMVLLVLFVAVVGNLSANPAFARRYELPCHFCHDGFPKLSVLGELFKERGYRLEAVEEDAFDRSRWLRQWPISVRAGVTQSFQEDGDASSEVAVRVMSAGNLGDRFSYWVDHWFAADGDGAERLGFSNAFVRFDVLPEDFYVKAGRIELDLPFTQLRSSHLTDYGLYSHNTGFEFESLGRPQDGIELGGMWDDTSRWSLAVVRGVSPLNSDEEHNVDLNLFGRLQKRFGERRAGVFLFYGGNRLMRQVSIESESMSLAWNDDVVRAGADVAWYVRDLHLYGAFLVGRNSNSIATVETPGGTGEAIFFGSGFLAADYTFRDPITLSMRVELSRRPASPVDTASVGFVDVYPGLKIWLTSRLRLAMEFGFRNQARPTIGLVQAEFAF